MTSESWVGIHGFLVIGTDRPRQIPKYGSEFMGRNFGGPRIMGRNFGIPTHAWVGFYTKVLYMMTPFKERSYLRKNVFILRETCPFLGLLDSRPRAAFSDIS